MAGMSVSRGANGANKRSYFDAMYAGADDPYGLRSRWYEQRKRAVLMACLPQARYRSAYEPGCGVGELTVDLATRCDAVLASDFAAGAVEVARRRTSPCANVRIEQHVLPQDWPRMSVFDLIVLSEVGYFLQADALAAVAAGCTRQLSSEGTLVACDWKPDFQERVLPTAQVHAALAAIGLKRIVYHEEDDFLLQVWSGNPESVAQRELIR